MKSLLLQAGHQLVSTGATGAPGEQELNVRIRDRLCAILLTKKDSSGNSAFTVQLIAAYPNQSDINKDYDLALALHGDANIYGTGGGFVDYPSADVDMVNTESNRIHQCIEDVYFPETGIINHPERSNANTKYYYLWSQLSAKTPCVIMEMGVVQDAHDKVILADTDRVANGIAKGICKAFNVPWEYQPLPPPPVVSHPTTPEVPPTPPSPPPPPVVAPDYKPYLLSIKQILYGKGFWWKKLADVKKVITQAGV